MADPYHAGDEVRWNSPQGEVKGAVVCKITRPMTIKGHEVKASPAEPQFLVESDRTGARAAHKPDAMTKA